MGRVLQPSNAVNRDEARFEMRKDNGSMDRNEDTPEISIRNYKLLRLTKHAVHHTIVYLV